MDVLLVYLNQPRIRALELHIQQQGLKMQRERSGRLALQLATRTPPRLVISADALSDMSGEQFHAELRAQPGLSSVSFALLHPTPSLTGTTDRDVVLDASTPTADLWKSLAPLLASHNPTRGATLRGTLDTVNLFQLTASLHDHGASGQLTVSCGDLVADLFFQDGELIHAEHLALYGETAVLRVLELTWDHTESTFEFRALRAPALARLPRTLLRPTEQTLLELAMSIDHLAIATDVPIASD